MLTGLLLNRFSWRKSDGFPKVAVHMRLQLFLKAALVTYVRSSCFINEQVRIGRVGW